MSELRSLLLTTVLTLLAVIGITMIVLLWRVLKVYKQRVPKKESQVGFVVDTFHELVSALKEKERQHDALLKALESQAELRRRLSSLGEMAAGIAHELRNPMGVIKGYMQILSKKADGSLAPTIEAVSKEVSVMDLIINDFLAYARPGEPNISSVNLRDIVSGTVESLRTDGVEFSIECNPGLRIEADAVGMRQALTNLIRNSIEAMEGKGRVSISIEEAGGFAEITISDTGPGIPEGTRERIFQPFFTTKERGTGLGLAIVERTVVMHKGSIELVDKDGKGACFRLRVPVRALSRE